MSTRTMNDLKYFQSMPLEVKIGLTKNRIREWVNQYDAYISFSGGKDSTVLLDIVREDYPDMPAVFVDVPTQYPELKEFATSFDNVTVIKPKISFAAVCEKYGFPLISKEISQIISEERIYRTKGHDKPSARAKKLNGECIDKKTGLKSAYNIPHYKYLLDAPFSISHMCCKVMKKSPVKQYEKETGKKPITAQMTEESRLREQQWIKNGCNGFELKRPVSNPMSFWTEQDVLQYIKNKNLPLCSVYGEITEDYGDQIEGQMVLDGVELQKKWKTTGCSRTGCMLCGFGCHLEKSPNRFEMLKETHPGMYTLLDKVKNNGYTMREAIEWINEHGNMHIEL